MTTSKAPLKMILLLCTGLFGCSGNGAEKKPDAKNEYPPQVTEAFVESCEKAGSKRDLCECLLEKIQQKYTFEEFSVLESKLAGGRAPDEFLEYMGKSRAECTLR